MSLYWVTTVTLAGFLVWSSYSYAFSNAAIEGLRELGFPDFFRWQLLVLKLLAVVVLLLPAVPARVKEWAYAGVALFLLTAVVAHIVHRDPWVFTLINGFVFALLVASNMTLPRP